MSRANVIIGILTGVVAMGGLMYPARTVVFVVIAFAAPLLGGAIAAARAAKRSDRELEVDEAAAIGATVGFIGGFITAVPFPLLTLLSVMQRPGVEHTQQWLRRAGVAAAVGIAVVIMLMFLAESVIAAVITARVTAR